MDWKRIDGMPAIAIHNYGRGKSYTSVRSLQLVNLIVKGFVKEGLVQPIIDLSDLKVEVVEEMVKTLASYS